MPQSKTRKSYSEDTLQLALKEIESGCSLRSASLKYKIPRSTLQNRSSGKTQYQARPGPKKLKLSEENEKALADWILETKETENEVKKSMISKYAKDNFGCDGKFSHGWYRGFFRRNPQVEKFVRQGVPNQPYYGMDVELESCYLINKEEENSVESPEESNSHNGIDFDLNNDDEDACLEPEIKWSDYKFEKNEPVKVALCFACASLIQEPNSNPGIKCNTCLRTYHISCAVKQHREIDSAHNKEEIFDCLVCWTTEIAKK